MPERSKPVRSLVVLAMCLAANLATLLTPAGAVTTDAPGGSAVPQSVDAVAAKKSVPTAIASGQTAQSRGGPVLASAAGSVPKQGPPTSEAERISHLQRSLEEAEKRLQELKGALDNPESEFAKAKQAFTELDEKLSQTAKQQEASPDGRGTPPAESRQAELEELRKKRELAKERFDLAIQERKATQESIRTLEEKLRKDQQQLEGLLGNAKQPEAPPKIAATATSEAARLPEVEKPATQAPVVPAGPVPAKSAATAPSPEGGAAAPRVPGSPPPGAPKEHAPSAASAARPSTERPANKEIKEATAAAQKKEIEVLTAEEKARSVAEHIEILQKNIALERTLRDTARKQTDNAERTLEGLNEEIYRKMRSGEYPDQLRAQAGEVESRVQQARAEARRAATRLDELQTELGNLQAEQISVRRDVERKQTAAEKAQARVESLQNPFAPRNVVQWLLEHGPRLVAVALTMAVFLWLSRVLGNRLVRLMAKRGRRGTPDERENRAKTLLGVFRSVATLIIVGGGSTMALEEVGIPVGPLLGGAAVLGLAIAFGAQSLIKDYFTGFMVILEQQYLINDVIKIGDIDGQVERITLRMTVLRDIEGRVHFIPHGQIATVTNLTHNWSRALFEIPVAYKEDVDRVMDVLEHLGRELRKDREFAAMVLEDPTMLGVDAFGDSAVVIKFFIKTKPLKQWLVKRELLRRIKLKFDDLRIEIPFPHRTVYHHHCLPDGDAGRGGRGESEARHAA